MPKTIHWIDSIIRMLYVALLALFWFHAVQFLFPRFDIAPLPNSAIVWLLLVAWVFCLPLPYLSNQQKTVWFIIVALAGVVTGAIIYDDLFSAIVLVLGVTWFSLKKVIAGIDTKEIITLFMTIMIYFGVVFFFSYFMSIDQEEISTLIRFFLIAFFITIIGTAVTQLQSHDAQHAVKGIYKQWGIYSSWILGSIGVLSLGSIVILLVIITIYPLIKGVMLAIISPIATWILSAIPWLQKKMTQLQGEVPVEETEIEEDINLLEEWQNTEMSPWATLFWDILFYSVSIALIAFIIYKIVQYIRKNKVTLETKTTADSLDKITVEDISDQPNTWRNKLLSLFQPYSANEENRLRREYRHLLKFLRAKGIWTNGTLTVQQLNYLNPNLKSSSAIYEKLRYGEQNLSNEEMEQAIADIKRIMKEWKK